MLLFTLLSLFISLVAAAAVPRSQVKGVPAGSCCFTLRDTSSNTLVKQDKTSGVLYLGGDKPDGWYCLNLSDKRDILRDSYNNACFISPASQFKCLDPTIGPNSWTLKKSGNDVLLHHDNSSKFNVCPASSGQRLLWADSPSASNCEAVSLKAGDFKGTCTGFV